MLAILLTNLPTSWLDFLFPFWPSTPSSALAHRTKCRCQPDFRQQTILVTGVGMTKGLTLARSFWLCGHRVIGADFHANRCGVWVPWGGSSRISFSRAFDAVYSLEKPEYTPDMSEHKRRAVQRQYVDDVCTIIRTEDVDLWVSCSGVASALEDAYVKEALDRFKVNGKGKHCASIQFDMAATATLHEKSTFIKHTQDLGLLVPETHDVSSHEDVLANLTAATADNPRRKFILKPVGMDDANRGNMTLLPLSKPAETEAYVRSLPVSKDRPWILQQFIHGNREYCTHALIVDGVVKVFVACPSSELLMHYTALSGSSAYSKSMFDFTKAVAAAEKKAGRDFTGHLSFDFMAETDADGWTRLYAIECNPRAHTAVALFATPGLEMRRMVDAYISAIDPDRLPGSPDGARQTGDAAAAATAGVARPLVDARSRYWIGHDLCVLLLLPLWDLITWNTTDGTFELWDPWPFVALYHHYWPKAILSAWWKGQRWSRLNVSTTKMFYC
ncbi:hypothetical protein M406DRAFT_335354 [Cryphonectria parasitica EP155]|uniref:ATP-grasp domain-containing protein n=1 Tax=Cryphonectria parasitica (strain ATCC 38755 / EP155) TaxID=660469 RepID=A0A9P5CTI5_CRYP1|nr:uncharacterized protein M406DRAFT_335354 [Cryphonectria parasitica EP155]KAF3769461.1 hypothetical protein M406DRAFT_335354 [Cryphonectria parasitica EP155]